MNYEKIYYSIINKGLLRGRVSMSKKNKLAGFEKHHIIPKCAGGTNACNNLVFLTPREHFICHALLVKFCETIHLKSLRYALGMMRSRGKIVSGRTYEFAKNQHRLAIIKDRTGAKHSEETKLKISIAHLGQKRSPEHCEATRKAQLGKTLSAEHKKKLSDATRGRKVGPRPNLRGPKIKVTCPYCGIVGGKPVLTRFHFDNCKLKSR